MDDFILVFLYRLTNEANTYANKDDKIIIGTQLMIKDNRLYYCRGLVKLSILYIQKPFRKLKFLYGFIKTVIRNDQLNLTPDFHFIIHNWENVDKYNNQLGYFNIHSN